MASAAGNDDLVTPTLPKTSIVDTREDPSRERADRPEITITRRHRLTVLRAAWLFDGMHAVLTPDLVIVNAGGRILAVDRATAPPTGPR